MKIIVHTSDNPRIIVGKARNMQMIVEYQGSASNSNIIRCTETEFNALSSLDSKTIYAVTDNSDNLLYVYIGYDKLSLESETITKFGWVVNVSSVGYDTLYFFKDQSTANSWLQSPTAANAPLASTTVSNVGNTINLGKPQSGYYTLTTAIAAVPSASRKGGLCITFMVADGVWRTYRYKPATTTGWSTETNWEDTTSEIEEMLEELDDKKADKTGLHHSLGSGTSDGLAGTDVLDAEYTLRCTGDKMSNLGTGAAAIETVKGNTLVWNQLVQNGDFSNGTTNWVVEGDSNFSVTVENGIAHGVGPASGSIYSFGQYISSINTNDKYLLIADVKVASGLEIILRFGGTVITVTSSSTSWKRIGLISQSNLGGNNASIRITTTTFNNVEWWIDNVQCFNLTKMFGAGYEPSTVAEFEARYPLSYYAYNAGTLINNAASGIKTIGFNQWDEQWELGSIDANGQPTSSTIRWRCKNFIPVFPSMDYNIHFGGVVSNLLIYYYFYDAGYNYIPVQDNYVYLRDTIVTTPANARYMKFIIGGTVEYKTYNHDICINLSWSGYRNGEYEPYQENTVYFDSSLGASGSLATIKGKKLVDGVPTGDSVEVFPLGMKSAGTAYDEAKGNTANKVLSDNIVLSNIAWVVDSNGLAYSPRMTNLKGGVVNSKANFITTAPYTPVVTPQYNSVMGNNEISISTDNRIFIHDTSCTTREQLNTKLSNAVLCAELATPETYLLDNPLPSCYAENKLGTEERLPKDTASLVNAPLKYTVKYPMNIAKNYVSAYSISNLLTELATKFGAAMSKTITITPTFNENTQEFDYSITIT